MNIDHRVVENALLVEGKKKVWSTKHIKTFNEEIRFCEQIESNTLLSMIDEQTSPVIHNTKWRISSEDLNNLDQGALSVGSKGSKNALRA